MIPLAHRHKKKKRPPIRLRWDYEIREIVKKESCCCCCCCCWIYFPFPWPVLIEWVVASSDLLRAPVHSDSHPLMRITVAVATLRKTPWTHFCFVCFFFSAKNLKYKNRKKHPKRIHLRKHTHTHNNIHLSPVRLQFSPRNRVCNKIFFRCVSRAWEHREADRRERQQQEKKRKERKERKKKKKLLFWRWMSRVSRRRWRRRQSV